MTARVRYNDGLLERRAKKSSREEILSAASSDTGIARINRRHPYRLMAIYSEAFLRSTCGFIAVSFAGAGGGRGATTAGSFSCAIPYGFDRVYEAARKIVRVLGPVSGVRPAIPRFGGADFFEPAQPRAAPPLRSRVSAP